MFGVVPDSGTTPGDLAGVNATDASDGPCKVYMGSVANSVRWTGCTVYTGGRRQVVAAQATDFVTAITTTASAFQNLCFYTNGSAPTFGTAATSETVTTIPSQPTFSTTAPQLCLATIKEIAAGSGIGAIYDTRVFTTSDKRLATVASLSNVGMAVMGNGSVGQLGPTTATTSPLIGVLAAFSGTVQTIAINAIIVTSGPVYVKATAGTANQYMQPTATPGYISTAALVAAARTDIPYNILGISQTTYNAPGTQCSVTANADTCRGSVLTNINIR
jgi:hypothetical protein